MRQPMLTILMAFFAAMLLVAPAAAAPPDLPGMDEMMAQMDRDVEGLRLLVGKDFEVAYLQMMRSHHLAAVEMAQLVPTRATHPELKTLAQTIVADQQREIAQLEGWLQAWHGIATPMEMPMAGMDRMLPALMAMTGAEFEQAFLQMMVHHHEGAVQMSLLAGGRATHPELIAFGRNVITAQTREQRQMRDWALAWYGFDPLPTGHGGHGGTPMPGMPNTGGGGVSWQNARQIAASAALAAALLALPLVLRRRRLARDLR